MGPRYRSPSFYSLSARVPPTLFTPLFRFPIEERNDGSVTTANASDPLWWAVLEVALFSFSFSLPVVFFSSYEIGDLIKPRAVCFFSPRFRLPF